MVKRRSSVVVWPSASLAVTMSRWGPGVVTRTRPSTGRSSRMACQTAPDRSVAENASSTAPSRTSPSRTPATAMVGALRSMVKVRVASASPTWQPGARTVKTCSPSLPSSPAVNG